MGPLRLCVIWFPLSVLIRTRDLVLSPKEKNSLLTPLPKPFATVSSGFFLRFFLISFVSFSPVGIHDFPFPSQSEIFSSQVTNS